MFTKKIVDHQAMLNPNNKLRHLWDALIIVLTIIAAIEIPLRVVFNYPLDSFLKFLVYGYFIFFSIDIVINFRTAFYERGQLIDDPKIVAKKYLYGWFLFDFLAAFPFEILVMSSSSAELTTAARMVRFLHPKIFRIFSLTKLFRLVHLFKFMRTWQRYDLLNPSVLRLMFFLFWLAIVAHWMSLGWLALGTGDFEKSEIDNYIWALYWTVTTLTTIGYGDISPDHNSNLQMLYTMFVQISGASMYGYMIGNLSSILANIDTARSQFHERMEKINAFMHAHKVPQQMEAKVRNYYNYLWDSRRGSVDADILHDLPDNLKIDISLFLNRNILEKVPMFKEANEHLIRRIVVALQPAIYLPGDYIFKKGDIGEKMFFISKGEVEVVAEDNTTVYATLTEGNFFGEIALLLSSERTAGVRAKDYCDLYYLEKNTFEKIISNFPDFEKNIRKEAEQRKQESDQRS